ncbi:hypothetical protein GQ55_1G159800 [Panicum hallii var. hallii]|uniref:Uncharacterized protein n=1 Tax=Panicum hallii var. hallii TaxID=1504633 RepID=A0A2T7F5M7_9POAL|nr:hypothetical protein GQ55_1G159800 [Panicum hallii var. hallii]
MWRVDVLASFGAIAESLMIHKPPEPFAWNCMDKCLCSSLKKLVYVDSCQRRCM